MVDGVVMLAGTLGDDGNEGIDECGVVDHDVVSLRFEIVRHDY